MIILFKLSSKFIKNIKLYNNLLIKWIKGDYGLWIRINIINLIVIKEVYIMIHIKKMSMIHYLLNIMFIILYIFYVKGITEVKIHLRLKN